MNIDKALLKTARKDMVIGLCSVCHLEVRWSKARQWPLTAPPVHADCCMERDDRTRTPPHGDALCPEAAPIKEVPCRWCGLTKRNHWGRECPKRFYEAPPPSDAAAGKDYELRGSEIVDGATQRAMAGPELPHNEAGVPMMPDAVLPSGTRPSGRVPAESRLPSHVERAARKAYAAGHRDGASCERLAGDGGSCACSDDYGVDAFRDSLQREGDEAE